MKRSVVIRRKHLGTLVKRLAIVYISICLCLWIGQCHLMFHPYREIVAVPSASPWNMSYREIVMPSGSGQLKGWWIAADSRRVKDSTPPKVLLFLGGAAGNKSHYLDRVEGLRQLGFSLLLFDYRGYGESLGDFPSENQLYNDSQAAWDYLIDRQKVPPPQIFIYGESLGGAIALDLAVKHPQAAGAIVQSSFTSMTDMARWRGFGWLFPVDLLLTQKFDSIAKVRSLKIPVLFIHGTADDVVPFKMGQRLFAAAPAPKYLHVVSEAGHTRLLRSGEQSYLKAIGQFIQHS
ncbi:alpha/beta hydrolase [Chamaesiphon minutus]|uniref:alpha/beta hydrolase n=1 Tax=Chamaesiphon minutus TaxID=1173032 RepID=UPI0018DED72C|nr:alpha/beta fold hydrolase [Chamaesiphon minutus]